MIIPTSHPKRVLAKWKRDTAQSLGFLAMYTTWKLGTSWKSWKMQSSQKVSPWGVDIWWRFKSDLAQTFTQKVIIVRFYLTLFQHVMGEKIYWEMWFDDPSSRKCPSVFYRILQVFHPFYQPLKYHNLTFHKW